MSQPIQLLKQLSTITLHEVSVYYCDVCGEDRVPIVRLVNKEFHAVAWIRNDKTEQNRTDLCKKCIRKLAKL